MASISYSQSFTDSITNSVIESGYRQQIILAVYVNVYDFSHEQTIECIAKVKETFSGDRRQDNIIHYIIPVHVKDQPTRIECIYPHFISSSENIAKDFKQSIDNLGDKYQDFFRHMFSFKNELLTEKIIK